MNWIEQHSPILNKWYISYVCSMYFIHNILSNKNPYAAGRHFKWCRVFSFTSLDTLKTICLDFEEEYNRECHPGKLQTLTLSDSRRRNMAGILMIRCKTQDDQSINQSINQSKIFTSVFRWKRSALNYVFNPYCLLSLHLHVKILSISKLAQ